MTRPATPPEIALGCLFVLAAFGLALVDVADSDAWTHLAAGREIVRQGAIPRIEPWLYAAEGEPFQYLSWLFGTSGYLAWSWFGMAGVVLLRATIIAAAFAVLLLDSTWRSRQVALSALVLTLAVMMAYHRFVFRPDIVLMLCLGYCVHALARLEHHPRSRAILGIPLVALLWANTHGSVPVMLAPFAAFLAAAVAARAAARAGLSWPRGPSLECVPRVLAVLAVSLLASLANPNGWEQWMSAQTMMSTDWYRDEIIELLRPTWDSNPWPFVAAPCALASFALAGRDASAYRLLVLIPFAGLAFVSHRYVFLLAIVAAPVLAENLWLFSRRIGLEARLRSRAAVVGAGLATLCVAGLTLADVAPFGHPQIRPGLGANLARTPDAALAYLDRRGIEGHLFNTFELGGYIIWRDFPKRRPFVDGRGSLPPALLEAERRARGSGNALDLLEWRYGFSALVLRRVASPVIDPEVDSSLRHPGWALVFWDDDHRVYLRRDGPEAATVAEDEYRYVKPDNGFAGLRPLMQTEPSRRALTRELRRCVAETDSSRARVLLGYVLQQSGAHEEAVQVLAPVREQPTGMYRLLALHRTGLAHVGLGQGEQARAAFERALATDPNAELHRSLAVAWLQDGQPQRALTHLLAAAEYPDAPISTYELLAQTFRTLGRQAEAEAAERRLAERRRKAGIEDIFGRGVRAMLKRDYTTAAQAFREVLEHDPDSAVTLSNLGYAYYDLGDLDEALRYQQAALAADPVHANAHYGLSLIFERRGDRDLAVRHIEAYLELQPSGYFSRRAKQRLDLLRS